MTTPNHPSGQTHPYWIRLFVDLDPAGNPIGRGAVHFENGTEKATLFFDVPEPFDSLPDAVSDAITTYVNFFGSQPTLF